jgi:hypothetical protein
MVVNVSIHVISPGHSSRPQRFTKCRYNPTKQSFDVNDLEYSSAFWCVIQVLTFMHIAF